MESTDNLVTGIINTILWVILALTPNCAHAQHQYQRNWDTWTVEQERICNTLESYSYMGGSLSMESRCRTAREQQKNHCSHIDGYPDFKTLLDECRRLGK